MAYCGQCGNSVYEGDQFCGSCGAILLPDNQESATTQEIPSQPRTTKYSPPQRNFRPLMLAASAGTVVVLLAIAGAMAVAGIIPTGGLLGGDSEGGSPPVAQGQGGQSGESAPTTSEQSETTIQSSPPLEAITSATGVVPSSTSASAVAPPAEDASGQRYTYEPENAVDGDNGTAWQVEWDGSPEYILLEYKDPVTVSSVGIIPGYDKIDPVSGVDRFYQRHVVKEAQIEFSDGSTIEAQLDQVPQMQFVDVPETETDSVRITILDTYPPNDNGDSNANSAPVDIAAISEVEVTGP